MHQAQSPRRVTPLDIFDSLLLLHIVFSFLKERPAHHIRASAPTWFGLSQSLEMMLLLHTVLFLLPPPEWEHSLRLTPWALAFCSLPSFLNGIAFQSFDSAGCNAAPLSLGTPTLTVTAPASLLSSSNLSSAHRSLPHGWTNIPTN